MKVPPGRLITPGRSAGETVRRRVMRYSANSPRQPITVAVYMNIASGAKRPISTPTSTGPVIAPTEYAISSPLAVCTRADGSAKSFVWATHSEYTVNDTPP